MLSNLMNTRFRRSEETYYVFKLCFGKACYSLTYMNFWPFPTRSFQTRPVLRDLETIFCLVRLSGRTQRAAQRRTSCGWWNAADALQARRGRVAHTALLLLQRRQHVVDHHHRPVVRLLEGSLLIIFFCKKAARFVLLFFFLSVRTLFVGFHEIMRHITNCH